MNQVLNIVSVLAAFVFGTGALYLLLDTTVGRIKKLNSKFEWNGLQIKDFIFIGLSAMLLILFFEFKKPY